MIIEDIYDFMSWSLPGKFILVPVAIFAFSFIWWAVWAGTKFWPITYFWRFLAQGLTVIIVSYTILWVVFRPPPIPTRIAVLTDPLHIITSQNYTQQDWRKVGLVDLLKRRLESSQKSFVIQDADICPALARVENDSDLCAVARRMRVKWIVQFEAVDSLNSSPVRLSIRNLSGKSNYPVVDTLQLDPTGFALAALRLVENIAEQFGDPSEKSQPRLKLPVIPDVKFQMLYSALIESNEGTIDSAAITLTKLTTEYPTWVYPYQFYAQIHLDNQLGRNTVKVNNNLVKALDLDKSDARTYTLFGRYFLETRDWEEAESFLKLAVNLNPNDPRIYFYISRLAYRRLQDLPWSSTPALLLQALQLAPGYEDARLTLTRWFIDKYNYNRAKHILDVGVERDPKATALMLQYSVIELGQGHVKESIEFCDRILALIPDHPQAWYNKGQALLRSYQYNEAITAFDSSYAYGGTTDNLYCIGLAHERLKNYDQAIYFYQRRMALAKSAEDRTARAARDQINKVRRKIAERDSSGVSVGG